MSRICCFIVLSFFLAVDASAQSGIAKLESEFGVKQTADRLEKTLREAGMTVFARIDHANNAASVDMELRPTELLIFGNPKIGTKLMQCQQTVALDLPQKALVWEDEQGKVWLGFNAPQFLTERHGVDQCEEVIEKIQNALTRFAESATKQPKQPKQPG